MSELAKLDDGIRPAPLVRPLRLTLLPQPVQVQALLFFLAFLLVEGFLLWQLGEEGYRLAAWARFLLPQALILPFALRATWRNFRDRRGVLEFGEDRVLLQYGRAEPTEIDYRDIDRYEISYVSSCWLRISGRNGEEVAIPRSSMVTGGDPNVEIIRAMGPRLRPDAIQERGEPPSDAIARLAWDYFGDPPPVAMVPGQRYRYRDPRSLVRAKSDSMGLGFLLIPSIPLINLIVANHLGAMAYPFLGAYVFLAILLLVNLWRAWLLKRGGHDRFELLPDGALRVVQRHRDRIFRNPRTAKGFLWNFSLFGRPLLRYGKGLNLYFFDPRILEEDD